MNTDRLINTLDSIIDYSRYKNNHDLIVGSFLYTGLIMLCISVYFGLLLIWFSIIAKLLGYKYKLLSETEIINNKQEPVKILSNKFFVKHFGFRAGKLTDSELIEFHKHQMNYFFWLLPIIFFIAIFC